MAFVPGNVGGPPIDLRRKSMRHFSERLIELSLLACATVSLLTTIAIVFVLFGETIAFFEEVTLRQFFLETEWQPLFKPVTFGIWELVFGTINVVLWSLVFALPIGLAAAIYLSEYAHPRTRKILKPMLEALAGVPTVVYAYFALTVVTQQILIPMFDDKGLISLPGEISFFNSLGASLMLAVMILPTIASISEDAMSNVPRDLREAAYGLGSTRMEVALRVVFPAALSGIVAAVLLAIARVVGETMIVAIAAGSTPNLTLSPLESIQTMTGYMLQVGLGDAARGTVDYQSLFAVGSMLFLMTFALNVFATAIVNRYREAYE
jgi:phosphate transport system permease protein